MVNPAHAPSRAYWRMLTTRDLIEAARDSGHDLATVLGERLDDYAVILDELERRLDDLERTL
jgi:hypothetical protein